MRMVVYKYPLLRAVGVQDIDMPHGAKILSVAVQDGPQIVLWAVHHTDSKGDPIAEPATRHILMTWTGRPFAVEAKAALTFIGSVTTLEPVEADYYIGGAGHASIVWHVFEVGVPQ